MRAVNYIAPDDRTGYACAADGYVRVLKQSQVSVCRVCLRPGTGLGLWYECGPLTEELVRDAPTVLHCVPEYLPALVRWLRERGVKGPLVAMTVWETDRLPAHWATLLNTMDGVIVPSAWNQRVFVGSGVTVPTYVLPHVSEFRGEPADAAVVARVTSRIPAPLRTRFLFYSIGAWNRRKGNDLLVRAFLKAFSGRSDVALLLKTTNKSQDQRSGTSRLFSNLVGEEKLRNDVMDGKIPSVFPLIGSWNADEIRALHTLGQSYVTLTRGEGWGMGAYEAAFFGKPWVAPREGGHRAYLSDSSYEGLVGGRQVPVRLPRRNRSYVPSQRWFESDIDDAARRMLLVMDRYAELRHQTCITAATLWRTHDDRSIAQRFLQHLDSLCA